MKRSLACILGLTGLFFLLLALSLPHGFLYGSHTDWLSQHAALAETIRTAMREQHTLLPDWISLGGGSNGFQFSYYGYLRPDILIGCLLPHVPMERILIAYALAEYLASVLLFFCLLQKMDLGCLFSFLGSVLFLTASCFFHTHRQLMFVNFMPFLLLALLAVRTRRFRLVPLCLLLVYLHSFYYSLACLAALGWYWYQEEGKRFLKPFLLSAFLSLGMAAALLLPTGLTILEHRRASHSLGDGVLTIFDHMQSLLYTPYGMGLTLLCLYLLLVGLFDRRFYKNSLAFLLLTCFGVFSYVLNGTLYARAKILIPFLPLFLLHAMQVLKTQEERRLAFRLWPFPILLGLLLTSRHSSLFPLMLLDLALLPVAALRVRPPRFLYFSLLLAPCLFSLSNAKSEAFVSESEYAEVSEAVSLPAPQEPLFRFDSLTPALDKSNRDAGENRSKSSMYSSVFNQDYLSVYYDLLLTPVQINNRLAILPADNPFLLHFMGIRYLETTSSQIPAGFHALKQEGASVLCENPDVLPMAYLTDGTMPASQFEKLSSPKSLEALTRYTILPDSEAAPADYTSLLEAWEPDFQETSLPDTVQIQKKRSGYDISVSEPSEVTLPLSAPLRDQILLLQFDVQNHTREPVVITINQVKNKLSGSSAPYPNGNTCFHYQFLADSKKGLDALHLTLPAGHYTLKSPKFYLLPASIFSEKAIQPVRALPQKKGEVLACQAFSQKDTYFVTSIPLQRGMKLFIDGAPAPLLKVNEAFAGARLPQGEHDIRLTFTPPGKPLGVAASLGFCAIYLVLIGLSVPPFGANRLSPFDPQSC